MLLSTLVKLKDKFLTGSFKTDVSPVVVDQLISRKYRLIVVHMDANFVAVDVANNTTADV